jgi:hypothetical protein
MLLLVCPKCKGSLVYQSATKEMVCTIDQIAFPLRKGVPVLLKMDARKVNVVTEDMSE